MEDRKHQQKTKLPKAATIVECSGTRAKLLQLLIPSYSSITSMLCYVTITTKLNYQKQQ